MRKTERNLKRVGFAKEMAVFLIVQLVAIALHLFIASKGVYRILKTEDIYEVTVVVESTELYQDKRFRLGRKRVFGEPVFRIYSGDDKYIYSNVTIASGPRKVNKALKAGDTVNIKYYFTDNGFKKICSLQKGDEFFLTLKQYNGWKVRQRIYAAILFVAFEVCYGIALYFAIWHAIKIDKIFRNKKKEKLKKKRKREQKIS